MALPTPLIFIRLCRYACMHVYRSTYICRDLVLEGASSPCGASARAAGGSGHPVTSLIHARKSIGMQTAQPMCVACRDLVLEGQGVHLHRADLRRGVELPEARHEVADVEDLSLAAFCVGGFP